MDESITTNGFWGIVERAIVESDYIDEVIDVIDKKIITCPSDDFKFIWDNASKNFKMSMAQKIADYYANYILRKYCFE